MGHAVLTKPIGSVNKTQKMNFWRKHSFSQFKLGCGSMTPKNGPYWRKTAIGLMSWDIVIYHKFSKLFDNVDLTSHQLFAKSGPTVSLCFFGQNKWSFY